MISINRIGENITVASRDKEFSTTFTPEKYKKLLAISVKSEKITTMAQLSALLEQAEALCKDDYKTKVESFHPDLYVQSETKQFYLKLSKTKVSSIAIPAKLVTYIEQSMEKGIDVDPIIKLWARFLRNKQAGSEDFRNRFVDYISMTYIRPDEVTRLMEEGLSLELAQEKAKTFEVKITKEGLIAAYKVSTEVDWKFILDENGNPKKVNRYERTFNGDTGKFSETDNRNDIAAEDRLFMPKIQGNSGDAFYCEGLKGFKEPGHFIKVGCVHRLASWDQVNCDSRVDCVKGLHVGGLGYISAWGGEIHTCLVDPMHIGAIPNYSGSKAIRVLQYFVHGTLVSLNSSIYHSSTYASQTDAQWTDIKAEIAKAHGLLEQEASDKAQELAAL